MRTCFECLKPIDADDPCTAIFVNPSQYYFHVSCARKIVAQHIINTIEREEEIERRAVENRNRELRISS